MRVWINRRRAQIAADFMKLDDYQDVQMMREALAEQAPTQRRERLLLCARIMRSTLRKALEETRGGEEIVQRARHVVAHSYLYAAKLLRDDVAECVLCFDDPRCAVDMQGTVYGFVRPHGDLWLASLGVGRKTRNLPGGHETADAAARAAMNAGADAVMEAEEKQSGWEALATAQGEALLLDVTRRQRETAEQFAVRRRDRVYVYEHAHEGGERGLDTAVVHGAELRTPKDANEAGCEIAFRRSGVWRDRGHVPVSVEMLDAIAAAKDLGTFTCSGCR